MKSPMLIACVVLALCLMVSGRKPTKQDNEKNRPSKRQQGSSSLTCPSGKVHCQCEALNGDTIVEPPQEQEPEGSSSKGGLGDEKPANDRVKNLVKEFSTAIGKEACDLLGGCNRNKDGNVPKVIKYREQVVAGKNYFVQVTLSKAYFVAKFYETLHSRIGSDYLGVQGPFKESDPIEFF